MSHALYGRIAPLTRGLGQKLVMPFSVGSSAGSLYLYSSLAYRASPSSSSSRLFRSTASQPINRSIYRSYSTDLPPPKMSNSIPEKQWAQVLLEDGKTIEYKQIPVAKPGPDEILVKIVYSGVCHTDLHAAQGDWPVERKLPLVGGHEGAGVVVARGALAHEFEIGDHAGIKWMNGSCLACEFCKTADESLCPNILLSGYTVDGTFQQYCIAKSAHATKIPKNLPLDAVAPILCAGVTVYKGIKEAQLVAGQTLAIVGAGGGLGSLAIQYCKAMGIRPIAIDGGDEKRAMCEKLGAEVSLYCQTLFYQ